MQCFECFWVVGIMPYINFCPNQCLDRIFSNIVQKIKVISCRKSYFNIELISDVWLLRCAPQTYLLKKIKLHVLTLIPGLLALKFVVMKKTFLCQEKIALIFQVEGKIMNFSNKYNSNACSNNVKDAWCSQKPLGWPKIFAYSWRLKIWHKLIQQKVGRNAILE